MLAQEFMSVALTKEVALYCCEICNDPVDFGYVPRVTPEGQPIVTCRPCEVELMEQRED